MKYYVAGLMFDNCGSRVAMVEKKKFPPGFDWTLTPFNAIGGKIEEGEYPEEAMAREFREETGVVTEPKEWDFFLEVKTSKWSVSFFRAFNTQHCFNVRTMEEERIVVSLVANGNRWVPNLHWIIPMALNEDISLASVREKE
jgi:8-oxo-dGTP diphosphatase